MPKDDIEIDVLAAMKGIKKKSYNDKQESAKTKVGIVKVPQKMYKKAWQDVLGFLFQPKHYPNTSNSEIKKVLTNLKKKNKVTSNNDKPSFSIKTDFSDMPAQYKKLIDSAKKEGKLKKDMLVKISRNMAKTKPLTIGNRLVTNYFEGSFDSYAWRTQGIPIIEIVVTQFINVLNLYFGFIASGTGNRKELEKRLQIDTERMVETIKNTIEHEMMHYVQFAILPAEQSKRRLNYKDIGDDYKASNVEFGPLLKTNIVDFVSGYKRFIAYMSMQGRREGVNFVAEIDDSVIKDNLKFATDEIDYDKYLTFKGEEPHTVYLISEKNDDEVEMYLIYKPPSGVVEFFKSLKRVKPTAYKKAVKLFEKQVLPQMKKIVKEKSR